MPYAVPLMLFLIPLAFAPGPGNLFFAALAARFGARATVRALAGYHVAMMIITACVGWGFNVGTGGNSELTKLLGSLGALYVLFLAWKLASSEINEDPEIDQTAGFIDGVLLLVFNPKAYVIMALLFTQFPPAQLFPDNATFACLVLAAAFTFNNLVAFVVWIQASDRLAASLRTPKTIQQMNWLFSAVLAIVAMSLFIANWI